MLITDLTQSLSGIVELDGKCGSCGATTRLQQGSCVRCLLTEGLEPEQQDSFADFETILRTANVPDTQWRLANYEILEEIGRGGMGVIYRARQRHSRRIVALKRMLTYHADSHETLARFRREAEAAASLDHPNILPIYEVSETEEGLPFFSMKLATGGSLRAATPNLQKNPQESVRLMGKVARAIEHAHERGILHRDLQPGNVLFDARGEPLVSDFGLAKWLDQESNLTRTLTTLGTPGFIAPEQAEGSSFSPAADIYSLGAILFHLLCGRPPFVGTNALSVIRQAAAQPAPKLRTFAPSLDRDLETIISRCLERDPQARYQSADALAEDLERWLDRRPILVRPIRPPAKIWRWSRRNPVLAGAIAGCILLASAVAWLLPRHLQTLAGPPPDKSVAVLPFQNLSKGNEAFTDGVQDEILSSLAKVADLKVIGRSSVMQYKNPANRNIREIGQQLGVANLLEGSVQRSDNRVRVNAQLVNAHDESRLWAQTYDGDLQDVFGIQTEIAQAIAEQLRVRLSPGEKAAIAQPPTTDLKAHALYREALTLEFMPPTERHSLARALQLLEEAVKRDPHFAFAYAAMSRVHMILYFGGFDHTPARRELARVALENAQRIQPDAGEVHLAAARYWFHGFFDYDRARAELELARRKLPNDPKVYAMAAAMDRRQARWNEALRNFERAVELDPRDLESIMNTAFTYEGVHRYSDATRMYERAAALSPSDYSARIAARSSQALNERADLRPLRGELNAILAENPKAVTEIAEDLWNCAILERNRASAENALAFIPEEGVTGGDNFHRPKEWYTGYTARTFGDQDAMRIAFTKAHSNLEKVVKDQPDYAAAWSLLGRIDAALGRKEEAIREGRHACELLPVSIDAWFGPLQLRSLACIYAWTDEKELALTQLEQLAAQVPAIDYGELKLDPNWDPLRGDPRFEKLVAALAR